MEGKRPKDALLLGSRRRSSSKKNESGSRSLDEEEYVY